MIKKLLVVAAASALISIACFFGLHAMGGFRLDGAPWDGAGYDGWTWRWGDRAPAGSEISRNLPFSGGERLEIGYPAEITLTQGDQARFTITGSQRVLDQLRLQDGVLSGPDERPGFWWGRHHGRLRIDIVSPNTHEFHLTGAEKLRLVNFDQDSLILHAAGAVDVQAQGKAKRLEAEVAGAARLDLTELPVDDAVLSISGAGDASLDARNASDVQISGAGHVRLKCRPPNAHAQTSGFGSVEYGPDCSATPPAPSTAPPPKAKV